MALLYVRSAIIKFTEKPSPMKYFLHDCNSFNDEKISELFLQYGYEGLGLFYSILEKIGAQEKPIKTIVLKHQLSVGKKLDKCWQFLEEIGLISSSNGETFNERILSYSETYQVQKEKNRERISQWREKQQVIKNVTCYEHVSNMSKVKRSKEKLAAASSDAPIFVETNTAILIQGEHEKKKVIEFLRTSTDRRFITDEQIENEAEEFKAKYDGMKIGNLKTLCNTWANNIRPWQKQDKKPSSFI